MSVAPVALVTGGSGGIAPAIAEHLIAAGWQVVLTARRAGPLEAVAARIGAEALTSDATDPATIAALVATIVARHGRIDLLVNAAASSTPIGGAIETVDVAALIADLDVKVGGYLRYLQAVVAVMRRQGGGRIVNIGGLTGRSSDTLSGLRNAAVSHFTKTLSDQLAPEGITVNAVHPGIVASPHLTELFAEMAHERGTEPAAIEAEFLGRVPTRRLIDPQEIGRLVLALAGETGQSITGESIALDGGYSRGVYL